VAVGRRSLVSHWRLTPSVNQPWRGRRRLAARDDLMTQFMRMGARYVSTGTDLSFLLAACMQKARFVREMKP